MNGLLKYGGLSTKIRAMSSRFLSAEDYTTLANSSTVLEVITYLKEHPSYSKVFEPYDEKLLHRGDVEKELIQSLYHDYSKLYNFGDSHVRKFLKLYMKRYEIDLITYCLRIVSNHYAEPFDLNHKTDFFHKYSQISIPKLIASVSEEDFINQLRDTEYFAPLYTVYQTGAATLFDYNLALDLYYYKSTWKEQKKHLKERDQEIFTKDIGTKIDLLNFQWIYRSKKYYSISSSDIYAMIIPIHYHVSRQVIKELVETPTVADFIKLYNDTYYGKRITPEKMGEHFAGQDSKDGFHLEKMYHAYLSRLYATDSRKHPHSLAPINRYLYVKEHEIMKITTVLECIRYGIGPTETLNYIGGNMQ